MSEKKQLYIPFAVIAFFFLSLFAYSKFVGPIPFSVNSRITNQIDSFWVSGKGNVAIKPDVAYLSVGITENGMTVAQVQSQINQVMNNVTQRLEQLGLDVDKDVKTTTYSINPRFDWEDKNRRIIGYDATAYLEITIKDIEKVNAVVDESLSGGANTINSLYFDVEDKEKYIDEARKEAVAQAKERAKQAAQTAGFKLGKMISYNEDIGDDYIKPVYLERSFTALDSSMPAPATDISTGVSEIEISVTMTYAIE